MVGPLLIGAGAVLMVLGTVLLLAWMSGKATWFDEGVYDRAGDTKVERQFVTLYFLVLVVAPLLVGAILIVYGLTHVL